MLETTAIVPMTFAEWWALNRPADGSNAGEVLAHAAFMGGQQAEVEWCRQMIDRHLPEGGPYAETK